jgi:hypothetical protein
MKEAVHSPIDARPLTNRPGVCHLGAFRVQGGIKGDGEGVKSIQEGEAQRLAFSRGDERVRETEHGVVNLDGC